ncbi:MAG: hypothetical protein J1G04_07280 [Clostridiales bacterium]|nr:hypothetical protein [Clostridiales bacterium]
MDQIISTVVANGLWAVLFCGLLVYELKDTRRREGRYVRTINSLSDRLGTVMDVKSDTDEIKTDVKIIERDTAVIKTGVDKIDSACAEIKGGAACASAT